MSQGLARRLKRFARGDLAELNQMIDLLNLVLQRPPLGPHWYGYAAAQSASFPDTMRLDTEVYNGNSDIYSLSGNELSVKEPGRYILTTDASIVAFSGGAIYSVEFQVDTGSGFALIPGSVLRGATVDLENVAISIIHQLTNRTSKYRVRGLKISGAGDVQFDDNTGRLTVHRVSAED